MEKNEQKQKIVVLHRGWVAVGKLSKEGNDIVLTDASIIRRWGTTDGLGQLALNGPTKDTKLDKCGTIRAHELAVVLTMDCATEWK